LAFEWDEKKRLKVLEERGLDILYAALIFEGPVLQLQDDRKDYGEERTVSLGLVDDEPFVVVHTERGGIIRLITAWKGGRDDHRKYQECIARRTAEDGGSG
jgi:uncharacterized DUF497 family protein